MYMQRKIYSLLTLLALAFLLVIQTDASAQALTRTVKGKVVDQSGEPLAGVMVYTPDKKVGVATDGDGQFSMNVPFDCKQVSFTLMGFEDKTVSVDKVAVVQLVEDEQTIEATVVTGIYTRRAESFTGASQTLRKEDLQRVGNKNVIESLKNLDPSLLVMDNLAQGSNPNSISQMRLRGSSTFMSEGTTGLKSNFVSDANNPLFILDGFETSIEKIQDMDMNRVESITILKDASAKAIYGSKGGNGVIVIETKQLNSEKTRVTYTGNFSVEAPDLTSYNLCNAADKLEVERREGLYDYTIFSGTSSWEDYQVLKDLYNYRMKKTLEGESTYWLSKPLRVGVSNNHSVEIEMGTKQLKSIATVSYNNVQGAMKGSYREVVSGDLNVAYRHKKWIFRNIMSIAAMNNSDSPYGSFSTYASLNPYYSPYDSDGNLVPVFNNGGTTLESGLNGTSSIVQDAIGNPLYDATLGVVDESTYLDFTNNTYAEWQILKSLKLVGRFGITAKTTTADEFYPATHSKFMTGDIYKSQPELKGSYEKTDGRSNQLSADISAQFNKRIEKTHDIFATAQWNISQNEYAEYTNYASGFPNSRMQDISFAYSYDPYNNPTGYRGLNRNVGALLTTGYSYRDRYMMDATIKTSASNVFGTKNKWEIFWSLGAAWNLHNEDWMDYEWLHQMKLRASVGSSGNQNFSTNNSIATYAYQSNYYNGFTGAMVSNMENPNLGWEQKMDYNLGFDLRTKHVSLNLDAYIADTRNLVFSQTIVPSTGFTSVQDNLGRVRNKGIEAGLNVVVFQTSESFLNVFAKVAFNDNRITEISESMKAYNEQQRAAAISSGSELPVVQYYDGCPMNTIWAVRSLGIDPISGNEIFLDKNGNMTNTWSATDLYNCGSEDPLYNGNFGLNTEIHGWGLSAVMLFRGGGYLYNTTLVNKVENVSITENVDRRIFTERWHEVGQEAQFRVGVKTGDQSGTENTSATRSTSRFVQKNNTLTASSFSIYYEVPYKIVQRWNMERLRATLYANDLYTFSSIPIERGTSYPYALTFSFSLNATF